MNLVSFSIRTKGAHNFARRLGTVFTRFGFSEARTRRGLLSIVDSVKQHHGSPTFFIPAVVLERHPTLIAEITHEGAEIGVHGYVHNDYRTLSKEQQFRQTQKAISVFKRVRIPYYGFRNPYLGWTRESLGVFAALNFRYESNIAVLHDVVDLNNFSPLLQSGFAKSMQLFQAIPCSIYVLRPRLEDGILRIPTSIPDDEILFDRLRIIDPVEVGQVWSKVMQRVYDLGGLYTLNLHPERGVLCRQALDTVLAYARSRDLPIWIARIGEVAQWWRERSQFRMTFTALGEGRWSVEATCATNATILARRLTVEDQEAQAWYGDDARVQSQSFTVNAPVCPCIAVSEQTPADVVDFLNEQGYPVMRCAGDETDLYALFLDKPEGLGRTIEEQTTSRIALVAQIEAIEQPFLHFGCWPDGNRAALCISGDIDSVTVQDFFLRIVEVLQQR
jgi:peptidoglycan/xylan/chitin deacetylase (PgdA/CDA1 family)